MALPPEGEPGSIRTLLSSAVNAIHFRERFWPLEAKHGGARSLGLSFRKNDWGVYIFGLHLARTRLTIQPVQIDDRPRSKILRTSQCRLHTPNVKAMLTRSDATDVRQGAPQLRKPDADRRAPESAKSQDQGCPPTRVRIGDVLPRVLAMVNRDKTVFG